MAQRAYHRPQGSYSDACTSEITSYITARRDSLGQKGSDDRLPKAPHPAEAVGGFINARSWNPLRETKPAISEGLQQNGTHRELVVAMSLQEGQ